MKYFIMLFLAVIINSCSEIFAQSTKADTVAIEETIMNYLEGFYTGDEHRMEKALYDDLAKRVVYTTPSGRSHVQDLTAMALWAYTKDKKDESEENGTLECDITIYDIFGNIATAKAVTTHFDFIDYVQLGKINGDWKIINVLWAMKPKEKTQ